MAGGFDPKESGYIEVKDRIVAFYEKHPQGSLQSEIVEFGENIVVMKGYAYRTPDDPRPGIGHSQMPMPGKTTFTRDSEVENAETSAWGRAIAALGFEVKRSVASADEIRFKESDKDSPPSESDSAAASIASRSSTDDATPAQKRKLMAEGKKLFGNEAGIREFVYRITKKRKSADLTKDDMTTLFDAMKDAAELIKAAEAKAMAADVAAGPDDDTFESGSSDPGE